MLEWDRELLQRLLVISMESSVQLKLQTLKVNHKSVQSLQCYVFLYKLATVFYYYKLN